MRSAATKARRTRDRMDATQSVDLSMPGDGARRTVRFGRRHAWAHGQRAFFVQSVCVHEARTWEREPGADSAGDACRGPWQAHVAPRRRTRRIGFSRYRSQRHSGFPVVTRVGQQWPFTRGNIKVRWSIESIPHPHSRRYARKQINRQGGSRLLPRWCLLFIESRHGGLRHQTGAGPLTGWNKGGRPDPDSPVQGGREYSCARNGWSGSTAGSQSGPRHENRDSVTGAIEI